MREHKDHNNKKYSLERIFRYLKGDRKGAEAHRLEKAAQEDPFLSDALEGYEEVGSEHLSGKHLNEIEDYVNYRVSQEIGGQNKGKILRIAASLAILISASLWLWFSLFNQLADPNLADTPKLEGEEEPAPELFFEEEKAAESTDAVEMEVTEAQTETSVESPVKSDPVEEEVRVESPAVSETGSGAGEMIHEDFEEVIIAASDEEPDASETLIARLLEQEKEFWRLEKAEPEMAFNAAPAEIDALKEESVPAASRSGKISKKEKQDQPASGAALMMDEQATTKRMSETEITPLMLIDSLETGKALTKSFQDKLENDPRLQLLHAIYLISMDQPEEAILLLDQTRGRSGEQKALIDSLRTELGR